MSPASSRNVINRHTAVPSRGVCCDSEADRRVDAGRVASFPRSRSFGSYNWSRTRIRPVCPDHEDRFERDGLGGKPRRHHTTSGPNADHNATVGRITRRLQTIALRWTREPSKTCAQERDTTPAVRWCRSAHARSSLIGGGPFTRPRQRAPDHERALRCHPHDRVSVRHTSMEPSPGHFALHKAAHLVDRQWRWPANRSIVFPVVTPHPAGGRADEAGGDEGQIPRTRRRREANDREHPTRTDQLPHPAQTALGIHVVEHRARRHHVERGRLERVCEHISTNERGPIRRVRVSPRTFDARSVRINSDDVDSAGREIERQQPVATADIERVRRLGWDGVQHDSVVVDVQVPTDLPVRHTRDTTVPLVARDGGPASSPCCRPHRTRGAERRVHGARRSRQNGASALEQGITIRGPLPL